MKGKVLSPNSKNYNYIHKQLLCLERWLAKKNFKKKKRKMAQH